MSSKSSISPSSPTSSTPISSVSSVKSFITVTIIKFVKTQCIVITTIFIKSTFHHLHYTYQLSPSTIHSMFSIRYWRDCFLEKHINWRSLCWRVWEQQTKSRSTRATTSTSLEVQVGSSTTAWTSTTSTKCPSPTSTVSTISRPNLHLPKKDN